MFRPNSGHSPRPRVGEVLGMTSGDGLDLAGILELAGRELAHRLQHPEPGDGAVLAHLDQRLVHQALEQGQHHGPGDAVAGGHGLGRVDGERSGEHREAAKQSLLRLGQQRVAPSDRALDRLMPRADPSLATCQQADRVGEALDDLRRREHPATRGGELDGERYALEAIAHLDDGRDVVVGELEPRVARALLDR